MSMINTNLASLNAQRNLTTSSKDLATSLQRLSSGLRVNSAKDDAAGLSIATKMDSQIRGMSQAIRNANDGVSMMQTADGALANMADALQRMRELAVQGANGTNGTAEWANINTEVKALNEEIKRIGLSTKFNGEAILGSGTKAIQVGADSGQKIDVNFSDTGAFAAVAVTDITNAATASTAIGEIEGALTALNTERSALGTAQNRMATPSATCKVRSRTSPLQRAASWTPTSLLKPAS
jgi:flagellin